MRRETIIQQIWLYQLLPCYKQSPCTDLTFAVVATWNCSQDSTTNFCLLHITTLFLNFITSTFNCVGDEESDQQASLEAF